MWVDVVGVLCGEMRDYTRGNLARNILLLAIPMILEMLMQSVFELADTYFVGQLGAVGAGVSLIIIAFAIGFGMAMGVTAMVARRTGKRTVRRPMPWPCRRSLPLLPSSCR